MKFTLLVMTLNEIEGMKTIMPRVKKEWIDQIIIVDGGSTDGTIEWADENGYTVYVQKKKGFRHAYEEVMPLVQGDIIITFSPDGNSIAELIPDLVSKMKKGYDMVIVSRYLDDAKSEDDDFLTGFGNWFFTGLANKLHGGTYTDAMVIYRAYKKNLIDDLELNQNRWFSTPETLFRCKVSWEPLLSIRAARRKLKIGEIPGDEPPRIGGERKLKIWAWGATFLYQFVRDFLIWW
ncbi:MAG: glycosyltransferase family 2 protein [Desulfobacterales bacterium]|nr:glycosyltransferase family 2 protein [Desulfobacterales bacterium]MDP6808702.1 glycosyltransferase family 2 protein [Desulfobacterales bacterium]|tara:strand:+ start:11780 stop:12484 length:705 start_codon:yes stop_codon:yes gene_type:complete